MTRNVITLGLKTTVIDAAEIMRSKRIRQFPVIDEQGALAGIVSDRDIRDAMPSKYLPGDMASGGSLAKLRAVDIMTSEPLTVSPITPVDIVASILQRHKFGGLPVIDAAGRLVGIITVADVLRFFCSASGVGRGGPQIAFKLDARPGPLAALLADPAEAWLRPVFTSWTPATGTLVRLGHGQPPEANLGARYTCCFVEDGRTTLEGQGSGESGGDD
jgi:acetoin utilization protein AcuB